MLPAAALLFAAATATTVLAEQPHVAARNPAHNGGFETGTAGWTSPDGGLSVTSDARTGARAALLSGTSGSAALEDRTSTVAATGRGGRFRVSAWVRADHPPVHVDVRLAPRRGGGADAAVTARTLQTTRCTRVRLRTRTVAAGTALRVSVLARGLQSGRRLTVDDVALRQTSGRASRPPSEAERASEHHPAPAVAALPRRCRPRLPAGGTRFGASLSTSGQTIDQAVAGARAKYGPLPVVRVFDPGLPPPDAWARRGAVLHGVDTVTSFRARPARLLSGALDARLRRFFATAPRSREVYWSLDHEPEPEIAAGEYTAARFRAAFRHVAALARSVCNPHLHATLILTGFTARPVSHRDWRAYYPGRDSVDVIAWDIYNGATGDATRYQDPAVVFGPAVLTSELAGKPFAIAEVGTNRIPGDSRGRGRAGWLVRSGAYLRAQGALFVTYFDSTRDGHFLLDDPPSMHGWRALVQGR